MDYLYFDIECCDGKTMCSFGYVIVDNKFNIKEKYDILINPEAKFKPSRAGFDPRKDLAYSEDEFLKSDNFDKVYNRIKNILTKKNRIILGHSVNNDKKYLANACRNYKKFPIKISAFDTQKIYNNKKSISLFQIAKELNVDLNGLKEHKSCDDAEVSMLCMKAMCDRENCTIEFLLNKNKNNKKKPKNFSREYVWKDKIAKDNIIKRKIEEQLKENGQTYDNYLKRFLV